MKGLKKTWRVVRYTVGVVLLFLLVFYGLIQSKTFREQFRIVLLSRFHTNINGELSFGAITGNLLTYVTVSDVELRLHGEDVFRARSLTVSYNPLLLLRNKLAIRSAIIELPELTLRRSTDDRWNLEKVLLEKQDSPLQPSEPSEPWEFEIGSLEIHDGVLLVLDSSHDKQDLSRSSTFSFDYFAVLNLNAQASGNLSNDIVRVNIHRLQFRLPRADVTFNRIQGSVEAGSDFIRVQDLVVESERSQLKLNARVDGFDVKNLNVDSLEHSSTVIELEAENIDFKELKTFIPDVSFLNGNVSARLMTKGEFGQLEIEKLDISTARSHLHFEGGVFNLHHPEELFLSVNSFGNVIDPTDVVQLLPGISIPDYGHLGPVRLDFQFEGTPLVFDSKLVLRSVAGDLEGDLRFDFSKPVAEYRGSVQTRSVDFGRILQDDMLAGRITMKAEVDGRGFELERQNSFFHVELDTSQLFGWKIDGGQVRIEAKNRVVDLSLLVNSRKTKLDAKGRIDFNHADSTIYGLDASFTSLDLSRVLHDTRHASDLSFHLQADGWGRSLETLNGRLTLKMSPSVYRNRTINSTEASLVFEQADPSRTLISVRSEIIDADIEGRFVVHEFIKLIEKDKERILRIVDRKLAPLDSVFARSHPSEEKAIAEEVGRHGWNLGTTPQVYDFRFRANIKDLEPVTIFVGGEQFGGHGNISGTISGASDQLSVSLEGFIDDFFYGTVRQGVFIGNLSFRAAFEGLSPAMDTRDLRSSVNISSKSLFINRTEFSDLGIDLKIADDRSTASASAIIDSILFVDFTGNVTFDEEPYHFMLDSVRLGAGEYEWRSDGPLTTNLDNTMLSIEHAAFVLGSERVQFAGSLDHRGNVELHGDVSNVDMGRLFASFQEEELPRMSTLQGRAQLGFTLGGRLDSPIITTQLALDDLAYRGVFLGSVRSTVTYRNRMATLDVEFLKDTFSVHPPQLSVKGNLPIDLSVARAAGSEEKRFPDAPMNLSLNARGFPLAFLDPLLADFDELQGTVSGEINIQGTPQLPVYTGSISTENAGFFFVPNRLYYRVNATLQPEQENIRIVSMEITHDTESRSDRPMFVNGTVALKDFSISSFDLSARGQLLILSEGSGRSVQKIQGDLFASIGPEGLRYAGTLEQSRLTGTILIERANILFPALQQNVYATSPTVLNYVVIDDTNEATSDTSLLTLYQREEAISEANQGVQNGAQSTTILDGISYEVRVETKGDVEIRMIFNPVTGEELFAVLNGKLTLVSDGRQMQLIGEVSVADRSHYTFYKTFDARGKLRFTGDAENPELDIKAQYESTYDGPTKDKPEVIQALTVLVDLTITGTRYEPRLALSIATKDVDGNVVTPLNLSDPQADAISYILVGSFKNELTNQDRNTIYSTVGGSISYSIVTGLLSEALTDFFRNEFGFIRTVEFTGGVGEAPNLRLSGEILNAYWRFGGRIFTDISNANVSVQLSMGNVFNSRRLRNLMLNLERRVRDIQVPAQDKDTYGARLYYRITF